MNMMNMKGNTLESKVSSEARELKVQFRTESGKGVARKLRRQGRIPAIFYGSKSEPVSMSLDPGEMVEALHTPKLKNTIIRMTSDHDGLNGKTVLVKEIQRHPLSRKFLHVDFMEVYPDQDVRAMIPIILKGQAKGVDLGGTLEQVLRFVEVKCAAEKIPVGIELEVTDLDIGDVIKFSQLTTEEEVELLGDEHATVVSLAAPRVVEEVEAAVEEEGEAVAEGEPGADAKAEDKPAEPDKSEKK